MSFFGVTIETIEKVWDHPNADRLDLAKLEGMSFQFVVGKGSWKAGDQCLYFPVDSLIPPDLMVHLGVGERQEDGSVKGRLGGRSGNRVKTVRLRGQYSQGIIGPLSLLDGFEGESSPEAITEHFGVEKWEPAEPNPFSGVCKDRGRLRPLPLGLPVYDLEGADRREAAVAEMMDLPVMVMEKLEGQNFSVSMRGGGEFWVNQRRFSIQRAPEGEPEHPFWDLVIREGLEEKVWAMGDHLGCDHLTLYGEFLGPGVQGNIYKLDRHEVRFFDILTSADGFIGAQDLEEMLGHCGLPIAPILTTSEAGLEPTLKEVLGGRSVPEYSNGRSVLNPKVRREGVVIRPIGELTSPALRHGRLILKQRSPEYLSKSEL